MADSAWRGLVLAAHHRLRAELADAVTDWAAAGVVVRFDEPEALFTDLVDIPALLVPAASEPDRELVRSLRRSRCLVPILAVVNDISGHQTFLAISAGASGVLNVRLPTDKQLDAVLTTCSAAVPAARAPVGPALTYDGDTPVARQDDGRLVRMLCGTTSISAIAQQFYCSERSMYRRIRRLYQDMGVAGRTELRYRMNAASHKARVVPTRRSIGPG
ncbi:hypothetical protein [Actinokineospora diospyrosa]|uniref:DNA-binding response regulator, NarL/FixJ family, contains REC and HTH domains n=1 Tax=Actinokineospora diospyrosa TaxID=103728 RepID=A0ABT1IFY5_9PSEU|nr:hypothetical protein [Actinokineospora diospyrosa]MCP2271556.1 DNA-binding response regulator, NarL/FixJ family, contains REC and HTH domains [Actinokineospora diospyrosa]